MKDDETLKFPRELTAEVGLCTTEIRAMRQRGCRFYGKKTCLKWVREFIAEQVRAQEAMPLAPGTPERLPH